MVKANSIQGTSLAQLCQHTHTHTHSLGGGQGNKKKNLQIIYTPWSNLKKTADMDIGTVSFHDTKKVYHLLTFALTIIF